MKVPVMTLCIYLLTLGLWMQRSFQRLLHKQEGKRASWEYPFAVAGLNITFMLIQMLDLRAGIAKIINCLKFDICSYCQRKAKLERE
jgi:hypothetical protein